MTGAGVPVPIYLHVRYTPLDPVSGKMLYIEQFAYQKFAIYICKGITLFRVLISSYLFLAGYSHFSHFRSKGASFTRFLQVLFRMNFLTFVLCLCMNRPYQFYYFVPLVSFWFLGKLLSQKCLLGES